MVHIDYIGNLEDLLVLIDGECKNPKVIIDVESLLEILTSRRSQAFYKLVDVHSVTNATGESTSSISIWNIVNQLGMIFYVGRQ